MSKNSKIGLLLVISLRSDFSRVSTKCSLLTTQPIRMQECPSICSDIPGIMCRIQFFVPPKRSHPHGTKQSFQFFAILNVLPPFCLPPKQQRVHKSSATMFSGQQFLADLPLQHTTRDHAMWLNIAFQRFHWLDNPRYGIKFESQNMVEQFSTKPRKHSTEELVGMDWF